MFLRQGVVGVSPTIRGYGDFSEINPYFMQSEAFCDRFHDIIKAYFTNKIIWVNLLGIHLTNKCDIITTPNISGSLQYPLH